MRKKRDSRAGIIDLAKNVQPLPRAQLGTPSTVLRGILGGKKFGQSVSYEYFVLKFIYGEDGNFIPDEFWGGLYHREVTFFALVFTEKSVTPSGVGEMECVPEKISVLT